MESRLVSGNTVAARLWAMKRSTVRPNPSLNADVPHAGCARQRAAG